MSTASEIPPTQPSAPVEFEPSRQTCFADVARDIIMWRRRLSSILVLTVATAIWAALQVYRFNFLTLASWVAMILVAFLFFWGNICRLLSKEAPDLSWMEMSESSAVEMANGIIEWTEEGVRWMFRVSSASSRREWLEVAATLASCWLLSLIGSRFDLHTILYAGLVVAMTVPSIYVKYEHKIKECGGRLRAQSQRFYGMAEEKLRVLKNRVAAAAAGKKKEKKTE